jgi:hypothetical protein
LYETVAQLSHCVRILATLRLYPASIHKSVIKHALGEDMKTQRKSLQSQSVFWAALVVSAAALTLLAAGLLTG